jgi:putative methionine-R-sulfoxide reductase with GAF domain
MLSAGTRYVFSSFNYLAHNEIVLGYFFGMTIALTEMFAGAIYGTASELRQAEQTSDVKNGSKRNVIIHVSERRSNLS